MFKDIVVLMVLCIHYDFSVVCYVKKAVYCFVQMAFTAFDSIFLVSFSRGVRDKEGIVINMQRS